MTKEQIKETIEAEISEICCEFGLCREAAIEPVMNNLLTSYFIGELSKEDLEECANYLGLDVNLANCK